MQDKLGNIYQRCSSGHARSRWDIYPRQSIYQKKGARTTQHNTGQSSNQRHGSNTQDFKESKKEAKGMQHESCRRKVELIVKKA